MGLPTSKPTTLGTRHGLKGPRRGWEELGRKWRKQGGEGWSEHGEQRGGKVGNGVLFIGRKQLSRKGASPAPLHGLLPSQTIKRHVSGPHTMLLNQTEWKGIGLGARAPVQCLCTKWKRWEVSNFSPRVLDQHLCTLN